MRNRLNLRTILVLVMLLTSLSVIYQKVIVQITLIVAAIILLLILNPGKQSRDKLFHRLANLGRIILTIMVFQILFRKGGTVYFSWGIINVTSVGLNYGIASSLRFFLIIIVAGLLFEIPYYDFLLAFNKWKIPFEISFLAATVIHFIPIFNNQFKVSMEVLRLRGIEIGKLPLNKRTSAFLSLIFPVLAQAIYDIKYRTISLELRGFRIYPQRTYLRENTLKTHDLIIQIAAISLFIMIIIWEVI